MFYYNDNPFFLLIFEQSSLPRYLFSQIIVNILIPSPHGLQILSHCNLCCYFPPPFSFHLINDLQKTTSARWRAANQEWKFVNRQEDGFKSKMSKSTKKNTLYLFIEKHKISAFFSIDLLPIYILQSAKTKVKWKKKTFKHILLSLVVVFDFLPNFCSLK